MDATERDEMADTEEAASIAGERWVADSNLSPRFPIYTRANVGRSSRIR